MAAAALSAHAAAAGPAALRGVFGTSDAAHSAELNAYLKSTKAVWAQLQASAAGVAGAPAPGQQSYVVVMGNEAGDTDSVVCAIVYAYYQHVLQSADSAQNAQSGGGGRAATLWLPLINIPAQYLALRQDTVWVLARHGVDASALTFVDQIDAVLSGLSASATAQAAAAVAGVRVCLVDHNHLTDSQSALGARVTRIVDHHKDDALYRSTTDAKGARNIQVVGSCTTLIAAELAAHSDSDSNTSVVRKKLFANPCVAALLAATILIDTSNFSAEHKKATPADVNAFKALATAAALPWAAPNGAAADVQAAVAAELQRLRSDCSALPTAHLLLKDIKFGTQPLPLKAGGEARVSLAIASVPLSLAEWMARDGEPLLRAGLHAFTADNALHALAVMTTNTAAGQFARQLTLFVPQPFHAAAPVAAAGAAAAAGAGAGAVAADTLTPKALFEWLSQYLQTQTDLKLAPFDTKPYAKPADAASAAVAGAQPLCTYWHQSNVAASRKQVFPFVTAAIAAAKL